YYLSPTGVLVFSSELKSLVTHPDVPRQLDHASLAMLLVDRYVSAPWTMFKGVSELPPGTMLTWRDGAVSLRSYAPPPSSPSPRTEDEAVEMLDEILRNTVRSQLVADVPVGVFLSGGIDSSTVAAYAAEANPKVRTFSVGFASDAYDESGVARHIAQHLGTDHTEIRIPSQGFDEGMLHLVVDHVGQPLGDPSCIPTYLISRETSKHLKCVLSGDGGDEFFGGYKHIRWASQVRRVSTWPMPHMRQLAAGAVASVLRLPSLNDRDGLRRLAKGLEVSCLPAECQLRWVMSLWRPEEVGRLLKTRQTLRPSYETAFAQVSQSLSFEEEAMHILARTYLPGAILAKVDRMSMAASLEVRVPLLDDRVTAFAEAVSPPIKLRGAAGKHLLRRVGRDRLPRQIFSLPKRGFSIPLSDWFNEGFWARLEDLCAPGSQLSELFHRATLHETLSALRRKRGVGGVSSSALATRSWLLAQLGVWLQRFRVAL
ncbi:MAG: asparagine synthetase B family protein, partial [bacterium]